MAARNQVHTYKEKIRKKNDLTIDLDNMEPGVRLHGIDAVHPLTGKRLPVYVASYVLADYGLGSIMGVPLHDERDCAFALANGLPLI